MRDVVSGRLVGKPPLDELARSVAFSPNGKLLFVGLVNGTGTFLSTEDWKPAGIGIRGHGQRILNARFTPDGQTLATSSADGTVQFWDVASRRSIGAPLVVQRNLTFVATILSHDGSYLYALPTGTEAIAAGAHAAPLARPRVPDGGSRTDRARSGRRCSLSSPTGRSAPSAAVGVERAGVTRNQRRDPGRGTDVEAFGEESEVTGAWR